MKIGDLVEFRYGIICSNHKTKADKFGAIKWIDDWSPENPTNDMDMLIRGKVLAFDDYNALIDIGEHELILNHTERIKVIESFKGEGVKNTMQKFKVGDRVKKLKRDCTGTRIDNIYTVVLHNNELFLDATDEGGIFHGCCCQSEWELVSETATNIMAQAYLADTLTDEQKDNMSVENQALYELGIIDSRFQLTNTGEKHFIAYLFKAGKPEYAKEVVKEVAKIKAKNAKEKKAQE